MGDEGWMEPKGEQGGKRKLRQFFGDTEEVMTFSEDLHVDQYTHELVFDVYPRAGG